jgi:hypothetical protein
LLHSWNTPRRGWQVSRLGAGPDRNDVQISARSSMIIRI